MSRGSKRSGSGALALKLGLVCGLAGIAVTAIALLIVNRTLGPGQADQDLVQRAWLLSGVFVVLAGLVVGAVAYVQGAAIASRLTELGLGIAKIGRGSSEVRLRVSGNDEVTKVGRALQYLATDIAAVAAEAEQSGGLGVNMDPQVRGFRDAALPEELPEQEGFEVDGALSPGTRGGVEYYGGHAGDGFTVLFLIGNEGVGAISATAARMARDEVVRALNAGAAARKALHHTNRVLHKQLPKGACATACLLELRDEAVKLYQCGFRAPALVCRAGQVEEVNAEGLALGLDAGPVFEKGLRSVSVPVAQGVRLALANDAALRLDGFVDLVAEHAPKHTAPFMNLVLGGLESDAGDGGLREDVVLLTAKRW